MNTNNNTNSVILDLENLQKKYNNLLIKYKQSVTEYINFLNNEGNQSCSNNVSNSKNTDNKCKNNTNSKSFVKLQNNAYVGTGSAGESSATSIENCEADCASNSKCSGATFVSGKCNLRTGDSTITPASNNSYAIIPKEKQLLLNMNDLNNQLAMVNTEITKKIKSSKPIYDDLKSQNAEKSQILIKNFKALEIERENVKKLLDEFETLDTTENHNQIKISKYYYSYILLFTLVIACIILLIRLAFPLSATQPISPNIQYGGQLNLRSYYAVFFIILLTVFLNISLK